MATVNGHCLKTRLGKTKSWTPYICTSPYFFFFLMFLLYFRGWAPLADFYLRQTDMASMTPGGAWLAQGHGQDLIVLLLVREWGWGQQGKRARAMTGSQEEGMDRPSQPTGGPSPRPQGKVPAQQSQMQARLCMCMVMRLQVRLWLSQLDPMGPGAALHLLSCWSHGPWGPIDAGSKPTLSFCRAWGPWTCNIC